MHPDNQMLGFLAYSPVDALGAMELPHGEFLLVFNTLGVYVDMQGRKSRDREIMYPAVPTVSEKWSAHIMVYGGQAIRDNAIRTSGTINVSVCECCIDIKKFGAP